MSEKKNAMERENKIVAAIFVSVLIDLVGFSVIFPLYPSILDFYQKNDEGSHCLTKILQRVANFRNGLGISSDEPVNSVLFGGFVGALVSLFQFFNAPILGALSDRFGRRAVIIGSLLVSAVGCKIWAGADSFVTFMIARTVAGLAAGNVSISLAALADLKDQKVKSRAMAMIGAAYSIGFTVGPMIGAFMASSMKENANVFYCPAYFALSLCLIDAFFVYSNLPESLPEESRSDSVFEPRLPVCFQSCPAKTFMFKNVALKANERCGASIIGLAYFLYQFLFSGLEFALMFMTRNRYGLEQADQCKMWVLLGILMTLVQFGCIRNAMVGREIDCAKRSIQILILGFVTVGCCSWKYSLYLGILALASGAAVGPCLSAAVSNYGSASQKGKVMGTLRSLGALGRATGPIVCAISYWVLGSRLTYIIGGLALCVPFKVLNLLQYAEEKHKAKKA